MHNFNKITAADLPPHLRLKLLGQETAKKRHKYGTSSKADRTLDGIVFDSKKEMTRYSELKAMEAAGVISELELQPKWDLHVNGVKVASYSADFRYRENAEVVVEDIKSKPTKTPIYRLKKKILKAEYGISIKET